MRRAVRLLGAVVCAVWLAACGRSIGPVAQAASIGPAQDVQTARREIRLTGSLDAVHSSKIVVPTIYGQGGQMTLTRLVANGARVKEGDLIAQFDATQQIDNERNAQAQYENLSYLVEQNMAQLHANDENRASSLKQAQGALDKALLELQKGPVLSDITRQEDEIRADIARQQVASLKKSLAAHHRADEATLRYSELQRDRQKVTMQRWQDNIRKLEIHAPLAGMVALDTVYRNGALTHPQEGDQLYRGQPLVSIFGPSQMLVRCSVGEPDGAALTPGVRAKVYLDAYPDLVLPAHFEFASPVASTSLGSPIKTFRAVFRLDRTDPRLMPDLSAAVVLEPASQSDGGSQ